MEQPCNISHSTQVDLKAQKALLFLIDATGSMGSWIDAIRLGLPSLVPAISLTQAFDQIGIMSYTDYDQPINSICQFSGFCDCANAANIENLQTFASNLKATGGGGTPEAWKTALVKITELQFKGKLYILHLTDAPPHENRKLDGEGKKEKDILGTRFDYAVLYKHFVQTVPSFRYSCLTTSPHQFYCHLAQTSEGGSHQLEGPKTAENIRKQINRALNGWFGFEDPIKASNFINCPTNLGGGIGRHLGELIGCAVSYQTPNSINCPTNFGFETDLNVNIISKDEAEKPDKMLSAHLFQIIKRMQSNSIFVDHAVSQFTKIIESNPLALTISPILGKMWREFCKRRSDPRRDELIEFLSKRKSSLNQLDKIILDEWLKESYNAIAEINAELQEFMSKNETVGLLRFLPENADLCAQQIVHLLASGGKKPTSTIRAILSRMYIDTDYKLGAQTFAEDDDKIPLPPGSIPLNLKLHTFFEVVMHTVAPGTKLTRRYASMLALHSIQCGSILAPMASLYLELVKGRWINWKRHEDLVPEVPECWSMSFLNLILHSECQKFLTEKELENALFYRQVGHLLRFYHQLEVTVKVVDADCLDGVYPCHMMCCSDCKMERPLSLITNSGQCSYCHWGEAHRQPSYLQVRCYMCGSIYARDKSAYVDGRSKCYGCRHDEGPSPCCECSKCHFKWVQFYQPENGLPGQMCMLCTTGERELALQYKEYPAYVQNIFPDSCFAILCHGLGFKVGDGFKPNLGIYGSVLHIEKETADPVQVELPTNILFRNQAVQNVGTIWPYLLGVMSGSAPILPECSICMEVFNPTAMVPACGRRGCQQRVCLECTNNWYGKNVPGFLIYNRATMCQFCARVPTPQVLARTNHELVGLAHCTKTKNLDPDMFYGWCRSCLKPSEIGPRECAGAEPVLSSYQCSSCISGKSPSIETKECPGCTVTTSKISGCNHMHCDCGAHWCWECGTKCDSSDETYKHMQDMHGRIFAEDVPDDSDDD
jgi:hypothetical protein